jgi:hypothetical protein
MDNYFTGSPYNGFMTGATETLLGGDILSDTSFGANVVNNEVSLTDIMPTLPALGDGDFDCYFAGLDSLKNASTIKTGPATVNNGTNQNMMSPSFYVENNGIDSFYQNPEEAGARDAYDLFNGGSDESLTSLNFVEKFDHQSRPNINRGPIAPPPLTYQPISMGTIIPDQAKQSIGRVKLGRRKLDEPLDPEDEAKRRKNNEAVKKSRTKAKQKDEEMQKEFKKMKDEHKELLAKVKNLESELDKYKRLNYIQAMMLKNGQNGQDQQY